MLEMTVLTLFPEMFSGVTGESIMKRAIERQLVNLRIVNFRDFATDKHRMVDDYPFGGGAGMVLKPDPLFAAVEGLRIGGPGTQEVPSPDGLQDRVVLLTPQGRRFTQAMAAEFASTGRMTLICGHYEGFDDRVRQHLVTDEVSIGDFVLTGGEIPAMVIMDAVVRLLPGVLGNEGSPDDDSFATGLLEYPQYTRPAVFRDMAVPPVLLSGNHQEVALWRRRHALYRTWVRRPDLLDHLSLSTAELASIARWAQGDLADIDVPEKRPLSVGDGGSQ